tara:strand:+ start:6245 stop:7012 length:768 start_codon:yes stop_codon:yes gene_type:complete
MIKKIILKIADFFSFFWLVIPSKVRILFFTSLFILESRDNNPKRSLKRIFRVKDKLEWIINERAINYDSGIHPKHRLTGYHEFFIERIKNGQRVLDVGCGNGVVALDIAIKCPLSKIIGVDINKNNIDKANQYLKEKSIDNIRFIYGDINNEKKIESDIVVLSNILEHIKDRKSFLINIYELSNANIFLIRVPLFERDWQIPLRRELGIYYYSDNDHEIEHTIEEFENEMRLANLKVTEIKTIWGEIWATCRYEK